MHKNSKIVLDGNSIQFEKLPEKREKKTEKK